MTRYLLFMIVLFSYSAFARLNPLQIVHSEFRFDGRLANGTIVGRIDIVGILDRPEADGSYSQGNGGIIQYRSYGTSDWTDVTLTSDISRAGWAANWRRLSARLPATVVELRVCLPNEGCSVPYGVRYLPLFMKATDDLATPFSPNLKFRMKNVLVGGLQFPIGKVVETEFNNKIEYSGYALATIINCQHISGYDTSDCEVRVPNEILMSPGSYHLSAISGASSSQNTLAFQVVSVFKVIGTVPERIRSHLQTVLTFNFGGGLFRPSDIDITMMSQNCLNRRIPVTGPGNDQVDVVIPTHCMPSSGQGNLEFDVVTREGKQRVKVPYQFSK